LAVLVELAQHGGRRASAGFAAVAVLALAALSLLRNQDYANEIALWESTTRLSPGKGRVHNNLGYAYQQANRPDDARRAYTVALRLDPQDVRARYNLKRLDVP
jgi:Flp pilus assembly protein TadD